MLYGVGGISIYGPFGREGIAYVEVSLAVDQDG
jgi:hypothetical protein